jgi:flagellar M-ring protein FliF
VVNAAFNVTALPEIEILAWWQQPDNQALARSMAWPLAMVGLGVLVLLGLVRPGMKLLQAPPGTLMPINSRQPQLSALLNDTTERPGLPMEENSPPPSWEARPEDLKRLDDARRLAKENPMAVANIVKGWVNGEAGDMKA